MNLVRYEAARSALAECHRVDEVKDIRDKAEAMAAYARQAKDQEMILWATEIKVRAERKAGELLAEGERISKTEAGKLGAEARWDSKSDVATSHAPTLSEIGITKDQSSRWQQLASMTDAHFEAAVATAKDTAGQVTTAFMLREANKTKPKKRLTQAGKQRLEELGEAKGASMLVGYARMVIKALRDTESFTAKELEILSHLRDEINRVLE